MSKNLAFGFGIAGLIITGIASSIKIQGYKSTGSKIKPETEKAANYIDTLGWVVGVAGLVTFCTGESSETYKY